ncbi:zinc-dependent metalloprotease [Aestuariimicrobium ganziense]|uniref:zinc-dependent metalloprotease n=1 Tax=Aestuariimicrobium ganziense TaxID=2773677 RepID=UPI001945B5A1|nr:zinc-dependent metalloprotease [Aestuariimicrobium ganziense]
MSQLNSLPWIDWGTVEAVGHSMVPPGPPMSASERSEVVDELRRAAAAAPALVAQAAGLADVDVRVAGDAERVIDRRSWVSVNALSARAIVESLGVPRQAPSLARKVAGRAIGAQIGAAFSLLGRRVLGQYDPFGPRPGLVLVAPTIVEVERALGVVPSDFRTWVCLHEQTHRVQFATAPWLREHLLSLVGQVLAEENASGDRLVDVGVRAMRGDRREHSNGGLLDLVSAPAAAQTLDRVTAVMSLLEGHADVMMDRAGPEVIATLPRIRAKFELRRDQGGWQAALGKLLGMDAKIAQYRDGAKFCRTVVDTVGVEGFNAVWQGPESLPDRDELADPKRWMTRMGL